MSFISDKTDRIRSIAREGANVSVLIRRLSIDATIKRQRVNSVNRPILD